MSALVLCEQSASLGGHIVTHHRNMEFMASDNSALLLLSMQPNDEHLVFPVRGSLDRSQEPGTDMCRSNNVNSHLNKPDVELHQL